MNSDPGLNPAAEMDGSGAGVSGVTSEGCLVRAEEEVWIISVEPTLIWGKYSSVDAIFTSDELKVAENHNSQEQFCSGLKLWSFTYSSFGMEIWNASQFKVLHKGCWKKLDFERDPSCLDQRNENQLLAENPWVQHFMSSSAVRGSDVGSCNHLEKGSSTWKASKDGKL
ncbi:hypothetical protein QJS10_CPB19g01757 [Acorus calamus]|uniref:Uncharacterized protein n=1 Tax=Acorus calamus TaxID=4465 RepID=A0AAV9CKR0_ACOCL|nr:hypothetical protein QJS10_CPB19g01757 [Acorus calamus]